MLLLPILLTASAPVCPSTAFVTLEHGRIASATWPHRTEAELKSHSVLSQTLVIDATVALRPDATASHATSQRSVAGGEPGKPGSRDLPAGVVPWSDVLPSTLEQVVLRAEALGKPNVELTGASIFSDVKMTPHEKSFMELDPLKPASAVKCPALLLQGGNDLHVPPRSAERLATTMRERKSRRHRHAGARHRPLHRP